MRRKRERVRGWIEKETEILVNPEPGGEEKMRDRALLDPDRTDKTVSQEQEQYKHEKIARQRKQVGGCYGRELTGRGREKKRKRRMENEKL
jgi:hypothetical protein